MAVVLSFGYIKNQSGDKGSVFWPDLEFNIQRINDHSHNGVNSTRLDSTSIDPITQTVPNTGWASLGDGNFKQTITVLAGVNLDKKVPIIFDALKEHDQKLDLINNSYYIETIGVDPQFQGLGGGRLIIEESI
jgi:hypothetical protein